MPTTDASARVTDRRMLPVATISEHAQKMWGALWSEDTELVESLFSEWLDMSGYDNEQPFKFAIDFSKKYMDLSVYITCTADINGKHYEVKRGGDLGSGSYPKNDTPGEQVRVGASALMSIELMISTCGRKLYDEVIFPNADIDFRKMDTLFMLGQKEV